MIIIGEFKKKLNDIIDDFIEGYEESTDRHPKLGSIAPFIFKLFLAGLVFRAILFLEPDTYIFQEYLAQITTFILNGVGGNYQLQNALILGENGNYLVTRDCLGWKSVSAFIGLVFASTNKFKRNIKMLLIGTAVLLSANLVRIVTTVWLSEIGIISFEIIHTFLWRWGMTALVLLTWYMWLKKYRQPEI